MFQPFFQKVKIYYICNTRENICYWRTWTTREIHRCTLLKWGVCSCRVVFYLCSAYLLLYLIQRIKFWASLTRKWMTGFKAYDLNNFGLSVAEFGGDFRTTNTHTLFIDVVIFHCHYTNVCTGSMSWWRHDVTFSMLLSLCKRNLRLPVDSPHKKWIPLTKSR